MPVNLSAVGYAILMGCVALFQLGLALGLPWGAASMGGKYPGQYPPRMRMAALAFIPFLILLALTVLVRAGLLLPRFQPASAIAIWVAVAFSLVSVILNSITPSKIERSIWVPVTVLQLIASLIVALS